LQGRHKLPKGIQFAFQIAGTNEEVAKFDKPIRTSRQKQCAMRESGMQLIHSRALTNHRCRRGTMLLLRVGKRTKTCFNQPVAFDEEHADDKDLLKFVSWFPDVLPCELCFGWPHFC
jgi:hypothetical protein